MERALDTRRRQRFANARASAAGLPAGGSAPACPARWPLPGTAVDIPDIPPRRTGRPAIHDRCRVLPADTSGVGKLSRPRQVQLRIRTWRDHQGKAMAPVGPARHFGHQLPVRCCEGGGSRVPIGGGRPWLRAHRVGARSALLTSSNDPQSVCPPASTVSLVGAPRWVCPLTPAGCRTACAWRSSGPTMHRHQSLLTRWPEAHPAQDISIAALALDVLVQQLSQQLRPVHYALPLGAVLRIPPTPAAPVPAAGPRRPLSPRNAARALRSDQSGARSNWNLAQGTCRTSGCGPLLTSSSPRPPGQDQLHDPGADCKCPSAPSQDVVVSSWPLRIAPFFQVARTARAKRRLLSNTCPLSCSINCCPTSTSCVLLDDLSSISIPNATFHRRSKSSSPWPRRSHHLSGLATPAGAQQAANPGHRRGIVRTVDHHSEIVMERNNWPR